MNIKALKFKNTHLPLRDRIRQMLLTERRAAAFQAATPDELEEYAQNCANAQHLHANANAYAERLATPSKSSDRYAETRRFNEVASIKRQASEAQAKTKGFSWDNVSEPTEEEIDEIVEQYVSELNTVENVAKKLNTSPRRVQQLINELGIESAQTIGKTQIISEADVRRLEQRKTQRGPEKKVK